MEKIMEDESEPLLSKKDVEVIMDTNENPPPLTEKLKEASKVYKDKVYKTDEGTDAKTKEAL